MSEQAPTALDPLPDGARLIHIGPQKTGSTALQGALHRARAQLREHGVLYPGPTARPWEALGAGLGLSTPRGGPKPDISSWHTLLEQLSDPTVRVACISHEGLGRCTERQVRRVVTELGGQRPHVLAVARSYDRLFPSQWQQRVKARVSHSYEEWLRIVLTDTERGPAWRNLWIPHDTVELVRRWAGPIGLENLTLVVAAERDRTALPCTCERLLGLPSGLLELREDRANRSLTFPEVELVRGLNALFDQHKWSDALYFDLVASGVIPALVKAPRPAGAAPIPALPAWAREQLVELSAHRVAGLRALGVRVVGELDDLLVPPPGPAADPVESAEAIPTEVALRALEGMVSAQVKVNEGRSRRARAEHRAVGQRRRGAAT